MASKYNSEGYYDPTTYEALFSIEKEERSLRTFRPIVYICSPYAGDVETNVQKARRYCRFAVDKHYLPYASVAFHYFGVPQTVCCFHFIQRIRLH